VVSPRVLGYDCLHDYLDGMAQIEHDLAADLDDEGKPGALEHWAKAEAYQAIIRHIERELSWSRIR
jgi:hypothetical protein